jgi:NADH pyrophosphatase NudC (nudix superfamily)
MSRKVKVCPNCGDVVDPKDLDVAFQCEDCEEFYDTKEDADECPCKE